jgi:hypothetical protein
MHICFDGNHAKSQLYDLHDHLSTLSSTSADGRRCHCEVFDVFDEPWSRMLERQRCRGGLGSWLVIPAYDGYIMASHTRVYTAIVSPNGVDTGINTSVPWDKEQDDPIQYKTYPSR